MHLCTGHLKMNQGEPMGVLAEFCTYPTNMMVAGYHENKECIAFWSCKALMDMPKYPEIPGLPKIELPLLGGGGRGRGGRGRGRGRGGGGESEDAEPASGAGDVKKGSHNGLWIACKNYKNCKDPVIDQLVQGCIQKTGVEPDSMKKTSKFCK